MSKEESKTIIVTIKASAKWKDEFTNDLMRSITEMLPNIEISRRGGELVIQAPLKFSKRTIKLRIKKFLYQKLLKDEFRVISYNTSENEGYMVIERKVIELSYY
jgi:hypothetical protein